MNFLDLIIFESKQYPNTMTCFNKAEFFTNITRPCSSEVLFIELQNKRLDLREIITYEYFPPQLYAFREPTNKMHYIKLNNQTLNKLGYF